MDKAALQKLLERLVESWGELGEIIEELKKELKK